MRAMTAVRHVAGVLALSLIQMASAVAQGVPTAVGSRTLNFGPVFPGLVGQVARTDAANAGRFNLRGRRNAEVQVTLTLPATLTAGGGRTMPLGFGANDGGFDTRNRAGSARAFDPRIPLVTRLGNNGRLFVFLGGSVMPSPVQPAGTYNATITLTVAYTGN